MKIFLSIPKKLQLISNKSVNESNADPSEWRENYFIQLSVAKEKKIIENENQVNLRKKSYQAANIMWV